ncbi:NACHT domain-containing protein [Streptomyces sp. NPDC093225]|uniref:NACHT domain-containing protein n=1 Tax=Streptomyces sp. NPDC093225 TaxID=3366034 RepID=UPI003804680C
MIRILGSAALTVAVGVAVNQILNDGELSGPWLYVSLAVAVLAFLYSEGPTAAARAGGGARGGRRVYLRQLRASVRDMETVGIATHGEFVLRMHQVYVDVSLAPGTVQGTAAAPYLGTVPDEEAAAAGRRRSLASVLQDAEDADATRILAVIGGPGSGKTTLARSTALALCEHGRRPWARRLPVLLYLRDHAAALLADEPPSLAEVAVSAGWLEGKVSAGWLARRLDAGRCLVLLDGLDEVADPADRSRVVAWVVRQTQSHPHNVYVVTSRPHGYHSNPLPRAEVLQVRRFTGEQISRYLHQWHYAMETRARALTRREATAATDGPLARLRTRADTDRRVRAAADRSARDLLARLRAQSALYDLASNPLLLTMISNVHRYGGQLPGSRAELYEEMCEVLLHRRYEVRGLRDATGLTGPHKQHVVQHLALAMMRARVRDWPAADAARAIRRPLRQVPGTVTPEVFLEEARKSGLLVERDHGLYGFAHLTLQEYLAAALLSTPRAETGLLTANTDDPWWRETLLLWAAGNDATDVITTCLDSGTVPALALAADCADQARTVDPAARDRLEAQLAPPAPDQPYDPARERLLAGIQATRLLRETIPVDGSAALCARPVSRDLYAYFAADEEAAGRHRPRLPDPADGEPGAPPAGTAAVGMHAGDTERFVDWLNTVTGNAVHRLPRPGELPSPTALTGSGELTDPAAETAALLNRHTVWVGDRGRPALYQPPDVPWPYVSDTATLLLTPAADRRVATRHLGLLIRPPRQGTLIEGWVRVLRTALARAGELPGDPAHAQLASLLPLAVAHSVGRARDRCGELAGDPALRYVEDIIAALVPDRSGDPVRVLTRAAELAADRSRAVTRSIHTGHDVTRIFALERAGRVIGGLSEDLARAASLGRVLGPTLGRGVLDVTSARTHEETLASALDRVLSDSREELLPALEPDLPLHLARAQSLTEELGLAADPGSELGGALDAVIDLALGAHGHTLELAVTGCRLLSASLEPPVGAEEPDLREAFDTWLMAVANARPAQSSRAPEDPVATLRRAQDLLDTVTPPPESSDLVRHAVDRVLRLVTAIRDRETPDAPLAFACARFALLAAVADLHRAGHTDHEVSGLLRRTWQSLIAHDQSTSDGRVPRNQILLIVRDEDAVPRPNADVRPAGA